VQSISVSEILHKLTGILKIALKKDPLF